MDFPLSDSNAANILDSMPYMVVVFRKERIIYFNQSVLDIVDYTVEEMNEKDLMSFLHPEDKGIAQQHIGLIRRGLEPPGPILIRVIRKNGTVITVNAVVRTILFNNEQCTLAIARDIGSIAMQYQPSRILKSLMDSLAFNSLLGIWVDDLQGKTIYINRFLCDILGYSAKEITEKKVTDFFQEDSINLYESVIEERIKEKSTSSSYELTLIDKNGRPHPFKVTGSLLVDYEGNKIGSVGLLTSNEQTKKTSELLALINKFSLASTYKEIRNFWGEMLEKIISIFYAERGLIYIDGKIVSFVGEIVDEFDYGDLFERAVKQKDCRDLICSDDKIFVEEVNSMYCSIISLDQRPAGFVIIASPIKNLFKDYDYELLNTFSLQVGLAYENRTLVMYREEERSFASLLLDILSHDFVNANTSILGYLELLDQSLTKGDITKAKDYLERSTNLIERTETIIESIQKLTRVKTFTEPRENQLLLPIIKEIAEKCEASYKQKKIQINIECSGRTKVFVGSLVRNVFENLINNAIIYNDNQKCIVKIKCKVEKIENSKYVRCLIIDNGRGIPDEEKHSVFTKLSRGDERLRSGKGFGLYMSKIILESYGGDIWIENRAPEDYSQGTKMVLLLPQR